MSRVLIAAGGTGGHVYPAIATADVLAARGHAVEFVGGDRIETTLVPAAGYPLHMLPMRNLPREVSFRAIGSALTLVRSVRGARRLLKQIRPGVVLGFGGYPSAAPSWVAERAGVPVVLHEQNARLSLGNRVALRRAYGVAVSLPLDDRVPAGVQIVATGNPIRAELTSLAADPTLRAEQRAQALGRWGLDPTRTTVAVCGGSLGARVLNEAAPQLRWPDGVQVLHLSGREHEASTTMAWSHSKVHAVVAPYVDAMADVYSVADLIVARAGASTVAEILAFGLASVLVPLAIAPRGAQDANARALERAGATRTVPEGNELVARIEAALLPLISDVNARDAMGAAAAALAHLDAAERLADLVEAAAR